MDDQSKTNPREPDESVETAGSDLGQNIAIYLLDAAGPGERAEFERAVAALPEVRAETVQLAPVVVALGRIYDLDPDQMPAAYDTTAEPSTELKARVLGAVAPAAGAGPAVAPRPIRPQGRVRGGAPAVEPTPIRGRSGWRTPWAAAAAMLVIAVGVTLWALSVQNKYDDQSREVRAQSTEIANIRASSNASAFTLTATAGGPANAGGTLYYSPKDQQAVLVLKAMPALSDNSVYQIWFIKGSSAPAPGGLFKPSADGSILAATSPTIAGFDVVALTKEPAGGSKAPTTAVLLAGTVGAAAG